MAGRVTDGVMDGPLYTVGLMAEVIGVSRSAVRHWIRHGLLAATRRAGSIEWFDFDQLVVARRLAGLLASGLSLRQLDHQLAALGQGDAAAAARADGRIVLEGGRLLLYSQGRLVGGEGQLQLGFLAEAVGREAPRHPELDAHTVPLPSAVTADRAAADTSSADPAATDLLDTDSLLDLAAELAADGHLEEACEALRAILQAQPPTAEVVFALAELLYRSGDLTAARERFYMAIELDPDHLAARASLGCLLWEMGEHELAIAALDGVVRQQPDFADAHWQLAGILEETGRLDEAKHHLREFLSLAPESPWTEAARDKLGGLS